FVPVLAESPNAVTLEVGDRHTAECESSAGGFDHDVFVDDQGTGVGRGRDPFDAGLVVTDVEWRDVGLDVGERVLAVFELYRQLGRRGHRHGRRPTLDVVRVELAHDAAVTRHGRLDRLNQRRRPVSTRSHRSSPSPPRPRALTAPTASTWR